MRTILGLSYKIKFDSANRLKDLKFKGWIKNEIDKNQKVKIKYDKIYEETSDLIKTLKGPEILAIEKSIIVVENKINACSMKIGENRSKFDEIDKKLDKLKIKSSEIAQMIQKKSWKLTIVKGDFLICPKCKRPITPEMKQREKQNPPLCPICNRGFELTKGMEVEELKESQRLNAQEQQESINLMNLLKVEIEKNEKEILDLKNAKSTLEKNKTDMIDKISKDKKELLLDIKLKSEKILTRIQSLESVLTFYEECEVIQESYIKLQAEKQDIKN